MAIVHLADEMTNHRLSHVKVGNDPVAQGANRGDARRRAADHSLGIVAHSQHLAGLVIDSHYRGLIQDNAASIDTHQSVGSAQVYTNIIRK